MPLRPSPALDPLGAARWRRGAAAVALLGCLSCRAAEPPEAGPVVTPVYDQTTGRLVELVSDRNGDGTPDTRAFMDGTRVVRVEIDRDGDGQVDRWEYYGIRPGPAPGASVIERAEEADRPGAARSRVEFYEEGVLARVEVDADGDARPDKWESYRAGRLAVVELDTLGRGRPNRRLTYLEGGTVRVEDLAGANRGGQPEEVLPERH